MVDRIQIICSSSAARASSRPAGSLGNLFDDGFEFALRIRIARQSGEAGPTFLACSSFYIVRQCGDGAVSFFAFCEGLRQQTNQSGYGPDRPARLWISPQRFFEVGLPMDVHRPPPEVLLEVPP